MDGRTLKPGEIRLGAPCECHDARPFVRRRTDGELEAGAVVPMGSDVPVHGLFELEHRSPGDPPDVRRIKSEIAYTARGPAQVSSAAFRSGWDATFGKAPARKEMVN